MHREWMSISDMMSGLMLIFLFIAISFMVKVDAEKQEMQDVALEYRDTKVNLNETLYIEFENDLQNWDATITKDNSIIFSSPEVLFDASSSRLKDRFKTTLEEFFVRYIAILTTDEYKDEIVELRVEGHTSKSWKNAKSPKEIYLKNMQLSQERAFNVLSFCYSLDDASVKEQRPWLEQNQTRRVEFTIQLKSEEKVYDILSSYKKSKQRVVPTPYSE